MRNKATIAGRSYFFNALFVLINVIGLGCLFVGFNHVHETYSMSFKIIGFILLTLSTAGILIFRGRLMMSHVSRAIVGTLFIVSGILKINDPIGFSYKLTEYFNEGALSYRIKTLLHTPTFSLDFLMHYALPLAVIIALLELLIGMLLLLGGLAKTVSYLLLLTMCFFTLLTWHTAQCDSSKKYADRTVYNRTNPLAQVKLRESKKNKAIRVISRDSKQLVIEELKQPLCVNDCGCFGDAMRGSVGRSLTPNESFWKDCILLYLACWIFLAQWITNQNSSKQNFKYLTFFVIGSTIFSILFSWYFITLFGFMLLIGSLWVKRVGGKLLGTSVGSGLFTVCSGLILGIYSIQHEPIKDFRPYAVGSNLRLKMSDGRDGKYESTVVYINKKTGKTISYSSTSLAYTKSRIWLNKAWRFKTMSQKEIESSQNSSITKQFDPSIFMSDMTPAELTFPPIQKLLLDEKYRTIKKITPDTTESHKSSNQLVSLREYIVKTKLIFLLTSADLKNANWDKISEYQSLFRVCQKKHIPFLCITSSDKAAVNAMREKTHFIVPTCYNDPTELKAIARSNPSLMVVRKGVVIGKFSHRSVPSLEWMKKHLLK